jgi:hypothetical protein
LYILWVEWQEHYQQTHLIDNRIKTKNSGQVGPYRSWICHHYRKRYQKVPIGWNLGNLRPELSSTMASIIGEKVLAGCLIKEMIGNDPWPRICKARVPNVHFRVSIH